MKLYYPKKVKKPLLFNDEGLLTFKFMSSLGFSPHFQLAPFPIEIFTEKDIIAGALFAGEPWVKGISLLTPLGTLCFRVICMLPMSWQCVLHPRKPTIAWAA